MLNNISDFQDKRVWERTPKLANVNSTSNSFLNQYSMEYSLSLHYKWKHEKSVGTCSRPTIPLGTTHHGGTPLV